MSRQLSSKSTVSSWALLRTLLLTFPLTSFLKSMLGKVKSVKDETKWKVFYLSRIILLDEKFGNKFRSRWWMFWLLLTGLAVVSRVELLTDFSSSFNGECNLWSSWDMKFPYWATEDSLPYRVTDDSCNFSLVMVIYLEVLNWKTWQRFEESSSTFGI